MFQCCQQIPALGLIKSPPFPSALNWALVGKVPCGALRVRPQLWLKVNFLWHGFVRHLLSLASNSKRSCNTLFTQTPEGGELSNTFFRRSFVAPCHECLLCFVWVVWKYCRSSYRTTVLLLLNTDLEVERGFVMKEASVAVRDQSFALWTHTSMQPCMYG